VAVEELVAAVAEAGTGSVVVAVVGNAESAVVVAAYLSAVAESVVVSAVVRSLSVAVCPCYSEGRQSAEISLPKQGSPLPQL
jgi:hypothetical protein